MSTHQLTKLLTDTAQGTQPVVLSEGSEEVLQDIALVSTTELLQLLDDLLLVVGSEGRGAEDGIEFGVGVQDLAEGSELPGGLVEGGGLDGGSVLFNC